jgi:DNA-binding MarR family transcriptional regulator
MESTSDEAAWNEVVALHARVEHQLAKVLQRQLGLGLSEYRALSHLVADEQGGLRIQELAEALGLNESSVSRLAGRLEQDGLTERCVCDDDRRGVYAFITEAGRRRYAEAVPAYRAELAAALDQAAADPALAEAVAAIRGLRALGRAGGAGRVADHDVA